MVSNRRFLGNNSNHLFPEAGKERPQEGPLPQSNRSLFTPPQTLLATGVSNRQFSAKLARLESSLIPYKTKADHEF
jgi:hypothetical protein